MRVIQAERPCDAFTQWHQGFSPKEHSEMQLTEELRKWEQEQRQRDRQWQEDRRKEDLEWQARQAKETEYRWNKEHKLQRRQLVVVGIVGTLIFRTPVADCGLCPGMVTDGRHYTQLVHWSHFCLGS
jgi:hypothetical protein